MLPPVNLNFLFSILVVSSFVGSVSATTLKNVIIDGNTDTYQGPAPLPMYEPGSPPWEAGQNCSPEICWITPYIDPSQVVNGSWHDSTSYSSSASLPTNITLQFTGVAIYVFCLLGNNIPLVDTYTELSFLLDGDPSPQGPFVHEPNSSIENIQYNALVYAETSIPNGAHTLVIVNGGNQFQSLMLFDYAIYSTQVDENSNSTTATTLTTTETTPVKTTPMETTSTPNSKSVSDTTFVSSTSTHSSATGIHTPISSSHKNTLSGSGIAAGLISAGVLLIAAFLLQRIYRRRRRRMQQAAPENLPQMGQMAATTVEEPPPPYPVPTSLHPQPDMTSAHVRDKVPSPSSPPNGPSGSGTAAGREEAEELRAEVERLRRNNAERRRAQADPLWHAAEVLSERRPPSSESLPAYVDDRPRGRGMRLGRIRSDG